MLMWFVVIPLMFWGFISLIKYLKSESGIKQNKEIEESLEKIFVPIVSVLAWIIGGGIIIWILWTAIGAIAGLGTTTLLLLYIAYHVSRDKE